MIVSVGVAVRVWRGSVVVEPGRPAPSNFKWPRAGARLLLATLHCHFATQFAGQAGARHPFELVCRQSCQSNFSIIQSLGLSMLACCCLPTDGQVILKEFNMELRPINGFNLSKLTYTLLQQPTPTQFLLYYMKNYSIEKLLF